MFHPVALRNSGGSNLSLAVTYVNPLPGREDSLPDRVLIGIERVRTVPGLQDSSSRGEVSTET